MLTPLDQWLQRVDGGTAVERFARAHDDGALPAARRHRQLLPLHAPGPGEQYAFEVDLDSCTGCKGCVAACHSLNGLDEGESWRSVGALVGTTAAGPGVQHVTSACHHCVEPACLEGCPVDAYDKDPITGIVAHLDDQCIGCRYCALTCPYEVPRFNAGRGIVRKCDLCRGRLAEGEAPACAQACPNGAITVAVVSVADAVERARDAALVPGAPSSALTTPTTRYTSARIQPGQLRQPDDEVRPSEAHPPLSVMLVLTQAAVGAVVVALWFQQLASGSLPEAVARPVTAVGPVAGAVAIAASVGHLGRPLLAWRAVLGVRHSWLSREILAFGAFGPLAALMVLSPEDLLVSVAAAVAGATGVACSVLVYATTGRWCWRVGRTATSFALTAAGGGIVAVLAAGLVAAAVSEHDPGTIMSGFARPLALALVVATGVKLAIDGAELRHVRRDDGSPAHRGAALRCGPLRTQTRARFALGTVGGIGLPLTIAAAPGAAAAAVLAVVAALAVLAGELVERTQFFTAAAAPRMPGGLR